jgi:hypothetical protein
MPRKAIPETTQTNIFLKSRRRCCLCFWLKGEDEVKKGQIAHLGDNNENAAEDNLVFLCLEHHDEYDSIPRLSKGLREQEVRKWRDELYKEMEYRFRTVRQYNCELAVTKLRRTAGDLQHTLFYCAEFRLKNTGGTELRSPVVSIRLPPRIFASPHWHQEDPIHRVTMKDIRDDLFEPNGRIATIAPIPILLRDHSVTFFGLNLVFHPDVQARTISLEYRVDAEGMAPVTDIILLREASEEKDLLPIHYP